jgi:putative DNA primase/helicase
MNKKLSYDEILTKLFNVHNRGSATVAQCPVCGDEDHLYIKQEGDKTLAYCHKCHASLPAVLKALDMNNSGNPVAAKPPAPAEPKKPKDHGKQVERIVYTYRDPDGREAYCKIREKFEDGHKHFSFLYTDPDGTVIYKKPKPCNNLYNLDRLAAAKKTETLYIVEGEKCADAMTEAGFLATSTNTGAESPNLSETDKEILGKFSNKIVIPDNDDPGRAYAEFWQQEQGARILSLPEIWPECPKKGDIADYFQADGDPEKIRNYQFPAQEEAAALDLGTCQDEQIEEYFNTLDKAQLTSPKLFESIYAIQDTMKRQRVKSLATFRASDLAIKREFENNYNAFMREQAKKGNGNQEEHYTQFPGQPLQLRCGEWYCDERGVRKFVLLGNGNVKTEIASSIPLLPSAIYENQENRTEKIELSFFKYGKWKQILVPRSIVANKTKIIALADDGIEVTSENSSFLVKYISDVVNSNQDTLPRVVSIGHMGWDPKEEYGEFVPYSDSIQPDVSDQFGALLKALEPKGTLPEWYGVVVPLLKSPYMRITIAASLASVLIGPMHALPFILHLWGGTGAGKTVALKVAASIWGNPDEGKMVDTMNNTINYIMDKAGVLYSIPFFGDELQTIKGNGGNYDSLIYRVTGQTNRGRLRANGSMGRRLSWQNSFLFTGEEPITQSNSGGGAINRVIELECTEKIIQDGNGTVAAIADCHGVLGPAFVAQARQSQDTNKTVFKQFEKELQDMGGTGKQTQALALMLTAYDLFQSMAPAGCPVLTVEDVKGCIKTEQEVDVPQRAYEYVCGQIGINQNKFCMKGIKPKGEIWGEIVNDRTVKILKKSLEQILNEEGYSLQAVKQKWLDRDLLIRNKGRIFWNSSIGGVPGQVGKLTLPLKDD